MQKQTLCLSLWLALAPAAYLSAQRQYTDVLDRGLVAVSRTDGGVFCSWRINADEYYDVTYNLYRDGQKVNATPLNVSNFTDYSGTAASTYTVRAVVRGVEQSASSAAAVWATNYKEIVPQHDASLTSTYVPNDACCADVDGDGELEILLKYDNQNEINESYPYGGHNGEYSLFECLKQDGKVLWWVNCGPNMGDFQNNEQNIVGYDWDGDGKAEAVFRAADGTTIHLADGTTYVVGDASINYRAATGGGTNWFMHSGAEYLLYVDGATGKPYQCLDYPLPRLEASENPDNLLSGSTYDGLVETAWGDGYGHRSTKHFFGAPYLDGQKPSIFLGRGIYTRHKFVAYDVDPVSHTLVERWRWHNYKSGSPWFGQGYHNYSIADVDGDGRDEIVWGSMVIDDCGLGLSTTGLGHGDSHHVGDLNPYVKGLEVFCCNEDEPANNYRDATTSKIYYRLTDTNDAGRAIAGNFSNDFPGAIGWSSHDTPISCVTASHVDGMVSTGLTQNFRIYWDGDLQEECVDGGSVYKYGQSNYIHHFEGGQTNNSTKATPCYQGDLFGDWREEVIERTTAGNIRIYTTTDPTEWRNYSLWYDHQYRQAMVWQMCGYNQTPHTSYFLGELEGITQAPPPLTTQGRTVVADGGTITTAMNNQHVLVCPTADATVTLAKGAQPWILTLNAPSWVKGSAESDCLTADTEISYTYYTLTLTGEALTGNTRVVKQGDGILVMPATQHTYTGATEVWAGTLSSDGDISKSSLWLNRHTTLVSDGGKFGLVSAAYGSELCPGGQGQVGTFYTDTLTLDFGSALAVDLDATGSCDQITAKALSLVSKDWTNGPTYSAPVIRVSYVGAPVSGSYLLVKTAKVLGDVSRITVEGLDGYKYTVTATDEGLTLILSDSRSAENCTWTGAAGSLWDIDQTPNFSSSTKTFVRGDYVTFDDSAATGEVNLATTLSPGAVTFAANTLSYTLSGEGSISGDGKLTATGSAPVNIQNTNAYTGGTYITGGTIVPATLANSDGLAYGALGSASAPITLSEGGTLQTTGNLTTSQPIRLGKNGGTLQVENGTLILSGGVNRVSVAEKATLHKTGTGTLQLNSSLVLDTLSIDAGNVYDFNDTHFAGKTIIFRGGTLTASNSIYSYSTESGNFYVPENCQGTFYIDGRCDYTGTLKGAGTLNVHATWIRNYFAGNWSDFTGTINAYTDAYRGYSPSFEFNNAYGLGKATFYTQGNTVYLNGKNFAFGELKGTGSVRNDGAKSSGTSYVTLGGKNTTFTYSGTIVGCNLIKVGTGNFNVNNTTCLAEAGTLDVKEGALYLNNTSATTTMTGKNAVTVYNGGSVLGRGVLSSLYLLSGSTYRPGTSTSGNDRQTGTLATTGNLMAEAGSDIYVNILTNKNNAAARSYVQCGGTLTLNGTLHVTYRNGYTPAAGDSATLLVATTIKGTPTLDLQTLPAGLEWDTSTLLTDGVIRVHANTGIEAIALSDLAGAACTVYDIAGREMTTFTLQPAEVSTASSALDLLTAQLKTRRFTSGLYLIRVAHHTGSTVCRLILH